MFGRQAVAIPPVPSRVELPQNERWRLTADPADVLTVPGYSVAYWADPDAAYGEKVTRQAQPFRAVAVHYTVDKPVVRFIQYQHNGDDRRGGSYGYHVYIGRDGSIWQGAPLRARTNHIKHTKSSKRRKAGRWADGSNTIGVSLVGACQVAGRSMTDVKCIGWNATAAQEAAAVAVIDEIMRRYDISPCNVWGHGELQHDRRSYEGTALAKEIRSRGCSS